MKMFKKTAAVILAAAMASVVFAGCGSTDSAGSSGDNVFKIGGTGPLTGSTAIYGTAVKNGAELAIEEINAAGGVNGMTLSFDMQDDENNAEKALNAYNLLKDGGIQAFMGTVTSTPCVAVAEVASSDNMFLLTPSGSAEDCTAGENAFRICFTDPAQGTVAAQMIASKNLAEKVAVIYDSSDVYSTGIYQGFKAEAANQNFEIVTEQSFTSGNNTDFSVAIQQVKKSGADLVFLPIYYQQAALIITQANQAQLDVDFFGCDGLDGIIGQLDADKDLAEGVMLITPFSADSDDEKSKAFTDAYKAKYNDETPNQFAADAYDAIYAIKAAIEQANITDASMSYSDVCDAFKTAMTQITVEGTTGTMTWSADGEPTKEPKCMIIENSAYKSLD